MFTSQNISQFTKIVQNTIFEEIPNWVNNVPVMGRPSMGSGSIFCQLNFNLNEASGSHSAFIQCCSQLNLLHFSTRFFVNWTSGSAVNYIVNLRFASALVNGKKIIVQFGFLFVIRFQHE